MTSSSRLQLAPSLGLSPGFWHRLWRAAIWLGAGHLALQFLVMVPALWGRTDRLRDVAVYYGALHRLTRGVAVYQPWPGYGVQMTPFRFFYSPPFLLFLRPFAGLDFLTFARVWSCLLLVPFWVYAFCLSRLTTGRWDVKVALVYGLAIEFGRGYASISLGQAEPWMWMLFGLALVSKRTRAGWLALAMLVKIHPLWSLCLTLGQDKRAWKSALLFALPVLLASFWLAGGHNWALWWPSTSPVASQGTFNSDNWSLSFFGLRVLNWIGVLRASGTLPAWAKAYLSMCAVAGPLGTMFWARKLSPDLRLALVACAGVLCAPICWTLYFPLFLLPLAVWLRARATLALEVAH